jgi:hypothetical protein
MPQKPIERLRGKSVLQLVSNGPRIEGSTVESAAPDRFLPRHGLTGKYPGSIPINAVHQNQLGEKLASRRLKSGRNAVRHKKG